MSSMFDTNSSVRRSVQRHNNANSPAGANLQSTSLTPHCRNLGLQFRLRKPGAAIKLGSQMMRMPRDAASNASETVKFRSSSARRKSAEQNSAGEVSISGHQQLEQRSSQACCFCWCCCCSCSCLTVHNNEANNSGPTGAADTTEEKPSYEEVVSWGVSFDRLMHHRIGQKMFAEFLKSEYSDENILFWQACEELKREKNPEKIEEKARIIYEDFVSILSPKEVSLDSRVREIINNNMIHPSSHTFDEAQNQIYTLMHRDSYPRFVNSALYKKILASYGECEEL